MKDPAKSVINIYLRTNNCEPKDVEVKVHLDLWVRPVAMSYITPVNILMTII